jgi:heat-inducible transcriptional repressor
MPHGFQRQLAPRRRRHHDDAMGGVAAGGRAEGGEGVRIFIGSENKLFSLSGSSLIVAPFRDQTRHVVGVLGVIGPTRLNYARIIPMVDYTAKLMSRLIG